MSFEWDEQKREVNIAKHGVDFEDAKHIFDGETIEITDERQDYREQRIGVYGEVAGRVLFVIYTLRGNNRRIISARKAGAHEREKYYAQIAARSASEE